MNRQIQELNETQYPGIDATYPYSVRLEQTAKGARVSVHVYNRNSESAVKEAIETYLNTRK
jgi:hypothetical protein